MSRFNWRAKIVSLKGLLRFVLTWLMTSLIFVIIFSKIRFSEVLEALKQTDVTLFSLSIVFTLLAVLFLSTGRYRKILEILECRLSFFETLILRIGSLSINGILPFKMGELSRVAYLKKNHNLSYSRGVGSILVGYALSLFILLLFILIGWFFYHLNLLQRIYLTVLFLMFLSLVLLFKVGIIPHFLRRALKKFFKDREAFRALIDRCGPKTVLILFFYSLGFEGCKLLNTFLLFKALNIEIPYGAFFLFAPLSLLVASIPITFWGLGTREAVILLLFSSYATPEKLLGSSLLISFVNRLFPVLLGLFFMKPFLNRLLCISNGRQDN